MFTFIDAIVVIVLLVSAGLAFVRGFVHEVLAIGAWVGAGLAALYGFHYLEPWFLARVGTLWIADALTGLSLFLGTLLTLSLATKAIANRVKKSSLGSVDSSLGFLFGLARGWIALCLAFMVASWAIGPGKPPAWLEQARSRPWLQKSAVLIEQAWPTDFGKKPPLPVKVPAQASFETVLKEATGILPSANAAASKTVKQPPKGYNRTERQEMDRLIQTHQ